MKSGKMVDRFETAILNMEKEDSVRTVQGDEIIFTGSSSIRLWKTLTTDMLPMHAINRGFGGATIPEAIYYTNRIVIPNKPPLIVFYCGENDINDGYSPEEVLNSFREFDRLVQKYLPITQILFISLKPSLDRWDQWDQFVECNQLIKAYIDEKSHLHYIDISEPMLTPGGTPDSTIFIEDGLHMNEAGYERWTARIKPKVASLLGKKEKAAGN